MDSFGFALVSGPLERTELQRECPYLRFVLEAWVLAVPVRLKRSLCGAATSWRKRSGHRLLRMTFYFLRRIFDRSRTWVKITSQDTSTGCVSGRAVRLQVRSERSAAAFAWRQ